MIELDAKYVSIGSHPSDISTVIHYVENLMGVPYRYTKEFIHPVLHRGEVIYQPFYMFVRHHKCDATLNLKEKVYPYFFKSGYKVKTAGLGRGAVYLFSMNEFISSTTQLLSSDIYACLDSPPSLRPYQK